MKTLISAFFWFLGGLCFIVVLLVVGFGLIFFSRDQIHPVVRVMFRIQLFFIGLPMIVTGKVNVTYDKPVIFMGNHESLFDAFVIPSAIPRPFVGVEAAEQFSWPIWGWLIKKWGNIPIARKNIKAARSSLDEARNRILNGICIGIMPEGTRTINGEIGEFKKGPFHLALGAQADIIPFAMDGPFRYKSKQSWLLNPTLCRLKFGPAIPYSEFSESTVEDLRDRVREAILKLKMEISR